jgi:hypothetical protein
MNKMRVWWTPQVGANSTFYVPVQSVEEAVKIMAVLAIYDEFQYEHNIKPDFCNTGGLQVWDEEYQAWINWDYDDGENYYDDPTEFCREKTPGIEQFEQELHKQVHF